MPAHDWRRYLNFRCTGCGNCCRETVVCITDADVRRIVDGTGKSASEFVQFFTPDQLHMSHNDPLWVSLDGNRAVMGLRKRRDRCVFLDDPSNRCTIYEHRPVTCRDHPFVVSFSESGALERISISRIVQCPHELNGAVSRRELRTVHSLNERQQAVYVRKVRQWNRRKAGSRNKAAFLRFLGFAV